MQIRNKLTFYFILSTASLLLISFLLIYYFTSNERKHEFETRLIKKSITKADLLIRVDAVDSLQLKFIDQNRFDLLDQENISIFSFHGREMYRSDNEFHYSEIGEDLKKVLSNIIKYKKYIFYYKKLTVVGQLYKWKNRKYLLLASAHDEYGIKSLENLRNNLFNVFINTLTFLAVLGWFFSKKALDPIRQVMNEVDQLSVKDLSIRLHEKENQKDEISRLINTFNLMLDRIEKAFKTQKLFISHASHELMNPLSSITSQLEVALLSYRSQDEYESLLKSLLEDIKKLNELSRQLILLSKYSEKHVRSDYQKVRIDDLIWEIRKEFLSKNSELKINFNFLNLPEDEDELCVFMNKTLMHTCLLNLIENAVKFSLNKTIEINLTLNQGEIAVCFKNDGIGINAVDIEHIFEPFYRSVNTGQTKGYGIGLSIVKAIVDVHDGKILVESYENEFTRFKLILKNAVINNSIDS